MKCETPRQAYIRILESQAKGLPVLEEKDLIYAAELVRGKYLKGNAPENERSGRLERVVLPFTPAVHWCNTDLRSKAFEMRMEDAFDLCNGIRVEEGFVAVADDQFGFRALEMAA
jgi:hypothetical protein